MLLISIGHVETQTHSIDDADRHVSPCEPIFFELLFVLPKFFIV